jgi:hypothetical protein
VTYPAHHDLTMHDIPDRAGDPLLTGDQALVDMLVQIAYNAWRQMGSTHNAAPCAQALTDRLIRPQPGDPVYATDSLRRGRSDDDRRKGVGYLVVQRTEWTHNDEQWAEEGRHWNGGPRPTERVFYIQYGPNPGDICRWENATCQAIPYGDTMMRQIDEAARQIVKTERRAA